MKKSSFISVLAFLVQSLTLLGASSISFMENKGQWDSNIKFRASVPSGHITLMNDRIVYQQFQVSKGRNHHGHVHNASELFADTQGISGHVVSIQFLHALPVAPIGSQTLASNTHFFYGQRGDFKNVKSHKSISYPNIYQGIDLHYYESNGTPKYEYKVFAGSHPEQIQMKYSGAEKMHLHNGKLVIKTSIGEIIEQKPYAYQMLKNKKIEVPCNYKLTGNVVTFEFPKGFSPHFDLVIDPALIFSTYSGSFNDNWGNTATYDKYGNMYSGGIVFGNSFLPTTPGPFSNFNGGGHDVYILKFDPTGSNLIYAAYLGGTGNEFPRSMVVNNQDELVVLGTTDSPDFPITSGVIDTTYAGGPGVLSFYNFAGTPLGGFPASAFDRRFSLLGADMFISKLSFNGDALLASTFIGGTGNDGYLVSRRQLTKNYGDQLRGEVIVDKNDDIYFASNTYSNDIPYMNGFQNTSNGRSDGFVGRLSSDLRSVKWMSYLGGNDEDASFGIKVDTNDNVFVTGGTNSADIFSPASGINSSSQGGVDGYVAKIDPTGQNILASSYLGTTAYDQAYFIDLDQEQNIYVLGQTEGNYPMDTSVYHVPNGGQFLHALNNDLSTTIFSTVFGSGSGRPDISLTAFLVNSCAKIYISGWGGTTNAPVDSFFFFDGSHYYTGYEGGNTLGLPVTPDAYQSVTNGSSFYFLVLNKKAKTLEYATYFGGNGSVGDHVDGGTSRFDKKGYIYQSVCAGCGGNSGFPSSANAWSRTNNSFNCNNAAVKFDLSTLRAKFETFKTAWTDTGFSSGCADLKVLFQNESSGGNYYKWIWGDGHDTTFVLKDSVSHTFTHNRKVKVQLIAYDNATCAETDTASKVIQVGSIAALTSDTVICHGQGFYPKLIVSGDTSIQWTPNYAISNTQIKNPYIHPIQNTLYKVTVKDSLGCTSTDSAWVQVRGYVKAKFESFKADTTQPGYNKGCNPLNVLFSDSSTAAQKFFWDFGNGLIQRQQGVNVLANYSIPGTYLVRQIVSDTTCQLSDTLTKNILSSLPTATFPSNFIMCSLNSVQLKVNTNPSNVVTWSPSSNLSNPNSATTSFFDTLDHHYNIIVKDLLNCTIAGAVNITARNKVPIANFTTYRPDTTQLGYNQGCAPLTILYNRINTRGDKFLWDFGNGHVASTKDSFLLNSYTVSGIYNTKLIAMDTVCARNDTLVKPFKATTVTATFPSNFIMCSLSNVTLKVITDPVNTVTWSPPTSLGSPGSATTSFYDTLDRQYNIMVKDLSNCTISGSLNITAKNKVPKANFVTYKPDTSNPGYNTGCVPMTVLFNSKSKGGDQYNWTFGNGINTNSPDSFLLNTYAQRNAYVAKLVVTNSFCGYKDSLSKTIIANQPTATFPTDFVMCSLSSIQLKVITSPSNSVKWEPSTGLSNPSLAVTNYFGTSDQTYSISVSDLNNCTIGGSVKVTAKNRVPIPNFDLYNLPDSTLSNGSVCAPHSFFTKDKSQYADQNQWKWQTYQVNNKSSIAPSYSTEGSYNIRLVAINSICNLRDSVSKSLRIKVPHVSFPADTQVCIGTNVQLKVKSNSLKSIDWQPDININNNTIPNPTILANMPLGYLVTFEDTNSCTVSDTVLISNFPIVQPALPKYYPFCKRQTPTITLDPGLFKTYKWSKNGSQNPVLVVDTGGFYKVNLSDFNNCLYTDSSQVVEICSPVVFAPTAFSPNGDGKNDQFEVFGSFVTRFDISIYNRWGELIYHSDDFHFKWDGTFRGLDVPISAYPYVIHYEGKTTEGVAVKESLKGDVTLIR